MSGDVESGESILYPMMHDIPQERILFIRKIHSIVAFQLLLTVIVVSVVVSVSPLANFINTYNNIVFFFALCSICYYHDRNSLGYFFLLILTVSVAVHVGFKCVLIGGDFASGKIIILKVVILTTAVVISSSLYIFWATKRSDDFIFLNPFLFGALLVLILIGLIQILFPFEKSLDIIYGCLASIIIYGYIVTITYNLIKCLSYTEFILVSASSYIFVITLFLSLLLMKSELNPNLINSNSLHQSG